MKVREFLNNNLFRKRMGKLYLFVPGEGQGLVALAQSTAIAWAMVSICNDERASFGVMSGQLGG